MWTLLPSVCKVYYWTVNIPLIQAALLTYDTLLILPSEITHIWGRRVRLRTILYPLARYPVLLCLILMVYVNASNIPPEVRWFICYINIGCLHAHPV
jgi:Family of unknown function (DUF6533)